MFLVQYWTMKNFILLFIGLIAMARLSAQTIVNTETLMLAGDSGFMWTAGIGGDVSVGNSDVMDVNADAGLTWDWGRTALKVIGSWNSLSEEGESIQGNAFAHIRAEVGDLDRLQVFGFIQSSNNDVLLMTFAESRWGRIEAQPVVWRPKLWNSQLGRVLGGRVVQC